MVITLLLVQHVQDLPRKLQSALTRGELDGAVEVGIVH